MKINWNFLGGGGAKRKHFRGGGGVWIFSGTAHFSYLHVSLQPALIPVINRCSVNHLTVKPNGMLDSSHVVTHHPIRRE